MREDGLDGINLIDARHDTDIEGRHSLEEGLVNTVLIPMDDDKLVYELMPKDANKDRRLSLGFVKALLEPINADDHLSKEELALDIAYKKAIHLMQWWNDVDHDGDRCIDEKELSASFPSKDMAKELIDMLDLDGDRLITFTEVSWVVCKALSI
jgi:hypothetical protein